MGNKAMLTGQKLGAAIESAIRLKGVSKVEIARRYGIKPPSVTDWCKRGTITKDKLQDLMEFCADVVGPDHWGLRAMSVSEPRAAYVVGTITPKLDRHTQAVVDLMRQTDDEGRAMALAAVKVAIAGHSPVKAKARK